MVGTPPQTPILRPLKQCLYDKVRLLTNMVEAMAFVDCRFYEDHVSKTEADTNMTQSGQLGYPLEYDMTSVAVHPSGRGEEYKRRWDQWIGAGWVFKWIFGCNTPWNRTAVALMQERFPTRYMAELAELRNRTDFPEILRLIASEVPLPRYVEMTTPDRKPRRISSCESFRAQFQKAAPWDMGEFSFYTVVHGVLYAQL